MHGLAPNRFCYSAVIKALANGGQWRRALDKLEEMRIMGMHPDHVVFTAAIVACEKVGSERGCSVAKCVKGGAGFAFLSPSVLPAGGGGEIGANGRCGVESQVQSRVCERQRG